MLIGGAGDDMLIGGDGRDVLNGGTGVDTLIGGAGDDLYYAEAGDIITELGGDGYDTVVIGSFYVLPANVERLILTASSSGAYGNDLDNVIFSSFGSERIYGLGGNDVIHSGQGQDELYGGDGDDVLISETPARTAMYGEAGADRFVFTRARSGTTDFGHAEGDVIDLRPIGANSTTRGNYAFIFIGSDAFHGVAGELRLVDSGLQADLNGDGLIDFNITYFTPAATLIADVLL